jgi:hypothetical protein
VGGAACGPRRSFYLFQHGPVVSPMVDPAKADLKWQAIFHDSGVGLSFGDAE